MDCLFANIKTSFSSVLNSHPHTHQRHQTKQTVENNHRNDNRSGNRSRTRTQNPTRDSSSPVTTTTKRTTTTTEAATIKSSKSTRKMSSKNVILLVLILTLMMNDTTLAISCNRPCLNDGYMLMSNIFGYCRCVCVGNFVGDACQYPIRKRKLVRVYKLRDVIRNLIQKMDVNNDNND